MPLRSFGTKDERMDLRFALQRTGESIAYDPVAHKLIAKAAVLALARSLEPYRQEPGLQLRYNRLSFVAVSSLLTSFRRYRREIGVEIRAFLRDGVEKYCARALTEMAELCKSG